MNVKARLNPFPGLRSFEPDEDYLFFGREKQVDDLLGRLRRTRFLAVVGGSGSGKSSLIKSGLMPSLRSGYMAKAGSSWRVALLRPGADPIGNLARALNDPGVLGGDSEIDEFSGALLGASLRRSGQGLIDAWRQARLPPDENVLVVVDQFEELFRFKQARAEAGGRDEAVAFVKLLLEAARQDDIPIYVVLTMRSEFIGSCAEIPGLAEAVNDGQYLVPRMTRDELRLAITGPVAVGGGQIAPHLVTRVLNEIGDDADQLPVLQHAMMRTWDEWASTRADRCPIDFADYEAIGTMENALSKHADEAYGEITTERGRHLAGMVFKALTETTGQGLGLRRPCRVRELCEIGDASVEEITAVVDLFREPGRSFLVPSMATPIEPETIIDLSHESLMRLWTRLVGWTREESRSAEICRRLSGAALLHARNEAGLWRDPELQLTLNWRDAQRPTPAWARRYAPEFERAEAFLAASSAARDADAVLRESEAAARLLQERRVRRRTYALFGVSLVGLVAIAIFMTVARSQVHEANRQVAAANGQAAAADRQAAAANRQATASLLATITSERHEEHLDSLEVTGLLAIEAFRLDPSSALARHTLMEVLQLLPPGPVSPAQQGHVGPIQKMVVDREGRLLVTAGEDGKIVLWDVGKHEMLGLIAEPKERMRDLAISPDGNLIAFAGTSTISVWETGTRGLVRELSVQNPGLLAFSEDPGRLAFTLPGGTYQVLSTDTWSEVAKGGAPDNVDRVFFSPSGEMLLETRSGLRLASEKNDAPETKECSSPQFDAAGELVARCPNGYVRFKVANGSLRREEDFEIPRNLAELWVNAPDEKHTDRRRFVGRSGELAAVFNDQGTEYLRFPRPIAMLAVPMRGEWIASSDPTGRVMFWQLTRGWARPLAPEEDVRDLTFSHNEKFLATAERGTAERGGVVRIFDPAQGREIKRIPLPLGPGPKAELKYPRFSPDDSLLAVLGSDELRFIRTSDWTVLPDRTLTPSKAGAPAMSLFFTPDGSNLLVADQEVVRRFKVSSWTALPSLETASDGDIYVSLDRRWIAFMGATGDPATRRYVFLDASSGKPTPANTIPGLSDLDVQKASTKELVARLAKSDAWKKLPDTNNALSGDADGGDWWKINLKQRFGTVIKVLEKTTEHPIAGLGHDSRVHAIAISRHGNWIGTVTDQKVFLWTWSQTGLIELTCALIAGNLTPEEWKAHKLEELGLGPHRLTCPGFPFLSQQER